MVDFEFLHSKLESFLSDCLQPLTNLNGKPKVPAMPDSVFTSLNVDSKAAIKLTSLIIGCIILLGVVVALFCGKCRKMFERRGTVAASPHEYSPENTLVLPSFLSNCQSSGAIQCTICCSAIQVGEMVRQLPICKHLFHANCISTWQNSNSTCPLCQNSMLSPDESIKASSSEPA